MTNEEIIKMLKETNDCLMSIYDRVRFNTNYNPDLSRAVDDVKNARQLLDIVMQDMIREMPSCFEVIALQDTMIDNEQVVEVKTNITGRHFDGEEIEVIFNGSIPSAGYLEMSCQEEEWGMEIHARNSVPMSVAKERVGGPFCTPDCIKYFAPGTYWISKGTVLGIAIVKQKKDAKQYKK